MDGDEIRDKLAEKGYSLGGIARFFGISQPAVSQVVHGRSTSTRVQTKIADLLELDVDSLWTPKTKPSKYKEVI